MFKYEYKINWAGEIYTGIIESENNEDAKRETKKKLKELKVPAGKYVFVDLVRTDDAKVIVEEDLWMA
ncbi:MAG: hypothetical protein WC375_12395 [Methanomassiliicoccales archaeon]|jgi:hypothetical protein